MADSPNPKIGAAEVDTLVGKAWSEHYHQNHDNAVQMFQQILEKWPEHIDANYGLALSLKGAGKKDAAKQSFGKAKQLVDGEIARQAEDAQNPRFQMLSRMIEQQLSTL
jgi:Flp pilus assembly protein TadD